MLKNYKVGQVKGDDRNLGNLIGWYAINREVIREMDGYPILTDKNTVWFVAHQKLEVFAFAAVKVMKSHAVLTYSYVDPKFRRKGVYMRLLKERMEWISKNGIKKVKADCTAKSLHALRKLGFSVVKEYRNWTKVEKRYEDL